MFAVLDKTEIIIYESNIFFGFFGKFPEHFQKFSGKLTSQGTAQYSGRNPR